MLAPHQREIRIDETGFLAISSVTGAVAEFHEGISVGEFADIVDVGLLGLCIEKLAGVTVGEFVVELRGHSQTAPAGRDTHDVRIHLPAG